ncbi:MULTISPECIES: GIY-YIG nuclease family protein [unclassified Sulfitobacter]|uniref:GIY-YIG nuclease family protein n=1 Tax=unclassified Sulfitobacter TaxID=196795 RepID=UPI00374581C9
MFEGKKSFSDYTGKIPSLFEALTNMPIEKFRASVKDKGKSEIYILYENEDPVYVGRTRNLEGRFRAHTTRSHNSASFALKRTRAKHPEIAKATYSSVNSRQAIVEHPEYGQTFRDEIDAIRSMSFRFLEVPDPIEQYLLELYATIELDLELTGFDSH